MPRPVALMPSTHGTRTARGITIAELRQDLVATHQRIMAYLASVPETAYAQEGRFLKRLRQDTYGHYREHNGQVVRWRNEQNQA